MFSWVAERPLRETDPDPIYRCPNLPATRENRSLEIGAWESLTDWAPLSANADLDLRPSATAWGQIS